MPHLFSSADASALPKDPRDRGLAGARVSTSPASVPATALPRFAMPDLESVDLDEVDEVDEVDADDRADITEVSSITSLRVARTEEAGGRNLRALRQVAVVPPVPDEPERPAGWLRSLWRGKA